MRRQARLFAIVEYLRGRRTGVTAEQLAERFEVTMRTIYRDLDALRDAQLPVAAERGRGGGYALDRAYTLPPVNFNPREAALLITLGRHAEQLRLLPFTTTLSTALDKVRAALSASAQRELATLMESLLFVGVPALASLPEVRAAVEQAWFEQRALRIHFVAQNHAESERRVRIVQILLERSTTVLLCHDLDRNVDRPYRLDRITRAELL